MEDFVSNRAVIRMLISIGSPENVPAFIEKVKRKEAVLSGVGHRLYKASTTLSPALQQVVEAL